MKEEQYQHLIVKYLTNEATLKEIENLNAWLDLSSENYDLFKSFIKINLIVDYNTKEYDVDKAEKQLIKLVKEDKTNFSQKSFFAYIRYAAFVVILLGIGFFIKESLLPQPDNDLRISDDSVTLKIGSEKVNVLEPQGFKIIKDKNGQKIGNQNNSTVDYSDNTYDKIVFNTLMVPYGKLFNLVLSDGTKVFLNSGSSITYPVNFLKTGKRKVFLKGEAFFQVSENKEKPFIVKSGNLNIEVLGTSFNVSSYSEDEGSNVVLVEGKVSLYDDIDEYTGSDHVKFLEPGEMGRYIKNKREIDIKKVNTRLFTSWKDGELIFRNAPFNDIIKILERHYNVKIVNNNSVLGTEKFNASFNNISIQNVLAYFQDSYNIEYTIKDNKIYIK